MLSLFVILFFRILILRSGFYKPLSPLGIPPEIQMGECGIQVFLPKAALPASAGNRLFRCKALPVFRGIPIVEFMHRDLLPFCKEQAVGFRRQMGIAKPHQLFLFYAVFGEHPCHGISGAGFVLKALAQIKETAAFRHGRQAALDGFLNGFPHGCILGKLPGI